MLSRSRSPMMESTFARRLKDRPKRSQEMAGFRFHLLLAFVMGEVREFMEEIGLYLCLTIRLNRM
jgi:hypothetical protein